MQMALIRAGIEPLYVWTSAMDVHRHDVQYLIPDYVIPEWSFAVRSALTIQQWEKVGECGLGERYSGKFKVSSCQRSN